MDFHFANVWEAVADTVPARPALICNGVVRSWREYDDRAARLAGVLAAHGLGRDSKVGLYLHNCNEYLEAQYGVFKIRGCPVNVNYRYKADELVYLLDNADAEAVVYQACYAMRIWEIRKRLPKLRLLIQVDDGTELLLDGAIDYERSIARSAPLPRMPRDPGDVYMLYTGGTTGMPKGVMYPGGQFSQFLTAMGAAARGLPPPERVADVPGLVRRVEAPPVSLPACPLMHGTGMWLGSMLPLALGGTVVTTPRLGLDPDLLWGLVEQHRVSDLVIVGDAFARPLLEALDAAAARGTPYDLTSLRQITSSGVMWSAETKAGLLRHHDVVLADVMGSSEGGMGSSVSTREARPGTARFQLNEGVRVITDDGRFVTPGSGEIGRLATSAFVPLGYFKDPQKSAETFREVDGVRYSFPGDYATVEMDGTITLLGRGSVCINTAGEKVFPEEVEEAVKRHPDIADCLVVGVPDSRFGERVVAIAAARGEPAPDPDAVLAFTREHLAGYKVPKAVLLVERVQRAPNGKADYRWAKATALAALGDA
ncbi:MAG: AMP-binding protein [Pseudomonadales bacterium]|nr:AMP-binding protein [Pseudomonadales bacterium]